jgi:hypothetical protein
MVDEGGFEPESGCAVERALGTRIVLYSLRKLACSIPFWVADGVFRCERTAKAVKIDDLGHEKSRSYQRLFCS